MTEHHQRQDADDRPDIDPEFQNETDDISKSETDWGLKKPHSGMSKEIKIAVGVLVLISGFFGYVLYNKNSSPADENAGGEKAVASGESSDDDDSRIKLVTSDSRQGVEQQEQPGGDGVTVLRPIPDADGLGGGSDSPGQPHVHDNAHRQYREQFEQRMADAGPAPDSADALFEDDDWENQETFEPPDAANQDQHPDINELTSDQDAVSSDVFADGGSLDGGDPFGESAHSENLSGEPEPGAIGFEENDAFQEPVDEGLTGELETFEEPDVAEESYGRRTGQDEYAAPRQAEVDRTLEGFNEESDWNEEQFHDPRTGRYSGVTSHSGSARSTTMVRRENNPQQKPDQERLNGRENGGRFEGYRSAQSHRGQRGRRHPLRQPGLDQHQIDDDASGELHGGSAHTHEGFEGHGSESLATDDRSFEFSDRTSQFPTGRHGHRHQQSFGADSEQHVVEANDSFWSIARQTYGDPKYFQALAKHNERTIPDPRSMRPGVVVATPPAEELHRLYPEFFEGVRQTAQIDVHSAEIDHFSGRFPSGVGDDSARLRAGDQTGFFVVGRGRARYRVGSGDSLGSIAQRHLGKASRWEEIYRLNEDRLADPHRLKIGTVLRLPRDARGERVVARPVFGR